ncbi:hypothetical protein DP124_11960 [Clostridium tetani]|uniref:hypothetical protein n=1 Tax=Clostridium TaxID=1485 RepID=UPI000F634DC0|nr:MULTISPECIES: hypothetical protein [Clostridium]RXI50179.1 hypothetical protein DP124_11960 [Clostridium tetani]
MFEYIIEDELETLKEMIKNNQLSNDKSNNFVVDYELEDELSHDTIWEIQCEFIEQAKEYLEENCPNKYVIYCDWCVHICSIDFAKERLKNTRYEIC